MDRRSFLSWVGVGWLASSLPLVIAACAPKIETETETETTSSGPQGFQEVGTLSELQKGQILVTAGLGSGPLLIVPSPGNPNAPIAVNPTCTHAGCTVKWQAEQATFVCPCHGSEFDLSGKVTKGPAAKPLPTYAAKIEANGVLVQPE